jgi:hypothetical protein
MPSELLASDEPPGADAGDRGDPGASAISVVPILTEVVELRMPGEAEGSSGAHTLSRSGDGPALSDLLSQADPQSLVGAVLADLAPRIDTLLEVRLRAALAPALARAAEGLIRDSRDGLAASLRVLVEESVARVIERRRSD